MDTSKRNFVWAMVATTLLLLAFGWGAYNTNVKLGLESQNKTLTLQNESLTNIRRQLEGDIKDLSKNLEDLTKESEGLSAQLNDANKVLTQKTQLLNKYKREAMSSQSLMSQIKELQALKEDLVGQIAVLRAEKAQLASDNQKLKAQIEELSSENKRLVNRANDVEDANAYRPLLTAESFKAEVLRRNDKLTVRSRRARQIDISFELPEGLDVGSKQLVYMSVRDSKNLPISDSNTKKIEVKLKNGKSLSISTQMTKEIDFSQLPQRVQFRYDLENKLKTGAYFVEFYTPNAYLGAVQFRVM